MRKLILILIILIISNTYAKSGRGSSFKGRSQTDSYVKDDVKTVEESKRVYEKIITVKMEKEKIHFNTKAWFIQHYLRHDRKIYLDSLDQGRFFIKGYFHFPNKSKPDQRAYVYCSLTIDYKHNKIRFRFQDIIEKYSLDQRKRVPIIYENELKYIYKGLQKHVDKYIRFLDASLNDDF